MSYFAEIQNGIVVRVIVADQTFIDSGSVGDPKNWVETSVDGSIRKNFAAIGHEYDQGLDAFIPPKQFNSWILNTQKAQYEAPVAEPKDGKVYEWNEQQLTWVEVIKSTNVNL